MRQKMAGFHGLLDAWAGNLEQYAKQNAPWNDQTGHARQAIHSGVDLESDGFHLYLAHGKDYGPMLEEGTGIFGPSRQPIKPVNARVLVIPGIPNPKDPSKPLMVRQIKGMKAKPIIKPTLESHKNRLKQTIQDYWEG
ncbi:hypothetical protein [Desulfotruncus arcticus]|nr:hypothetical protein [Desulfotruncus arcticus]